MHVPAPAEHARHDLDLIAAHVAGDLAASDRTRAEALLDTCTSCAGLRRDLIAIAAATRALPRTAQAPRDFRLDAAQAARLGRRSWLRRLLQPFGAQRSTVRPMAAAFTSLGLAGLLVANILPSLVGMAGGLSSAPNRDVTTELGAPTSAAAAADATQRTVHPVAGGPLASADAQFGAVGQVSPGASIDRVKEDAASQAPVAAGGGTQTNDSYFGGPLSTESERSLSSETSPLLIGSLALLALGLLLFGLRFAARRVG